MDTFLLINYAPTVGIVFLTIFLFSNHTLNSKIKNIFYSLIFLESLEMLLYSAELHAATLPEPTTLRILFSVLGHSIRVILVYLILLLTINERKNKKEELIWAIPAVINMLIVSTAFFSDICFSYTSLNIFVRGPLGYVTFTLLFLYLIAILVMTIAKAKNKKPLETVIITCIILLVSFSIIVETMLDATGIGRTSIILATLFYYMLFQTELYKNIIDKELQMRKEYEYKSKIDGLTGLLTKTSFTEEVKLFLKELNNERYAIIFIDIDNFKQVNDVLGHLVGDVAIQDISDKLKNIFRQTDIVGRFGGDEFCALLPNISLNALNERLEEVLSTVSDKYVDDNNASVVISTSIGAVYVQESKSVDYEQLLNLADKAVYEAKNKGKNRFTLIEYNKYENIQ